MAQQGVVTVLWLLLGAPLGALLLVSARTRPLALPSMLLGASAVAALALTAMRPRTALFEPVRDHLGAFLLVGTAAVWLVAWLMAFELPARVAPLPDAQRRHGRRAGAAVLTLAALLVASREAAARGSLGGRLHAAAMHALEGPEPHTLRLAEVADFEWDHVAVLGPYQKLDGFEDLPVRLGQALPYMLGQSEWGLVFMRDGKRVRVHRQPRNRGDLGSRSRLLSRDEAVAEGRLRPNAAEPHLELRFR